MNKPSELQATGGTAKDYYMKQKTVLDNGVSILSKSEVNMDSGRIVHAFTLHARSNNAIGELPKPTPASDASVPISAYAPPTVRYKKSIAHSRFCQLGNTLDMVGQLG